METTVLERQETMSALEQQVRNQLATMGITDTMPNYDTILQGFLEAKQKEVELQEENERLRAVRSKTVKAVPLPPAKQLFLDLLEGMSTEEDKKEDNFRNIAALVLATAQKLARVAGLEGDEDSVLDFTKELMHYSDARDSLIYLLQDAFATAKAQDKVAYGRKRQSNSSTSVTTPATAEETEEPVF